MNPLTAEWIAKASADLATAGREMRARKDTNYDAVCFHAQQCVEKLLKAALDLTPINGTVEK
jgi:HEPN domain-containing protein